MKWTTFGLYIVIAITVYIVVADALDYNYYTQPINHLPGATPLQYFTMIFKWLAIITICVVLLRIIANNKLMSTTPH
jgi:hypothetical protein